MRDGRHSITAGREPNRHASPSVDLGVERRRPEDGRVVIDPVNLVPDYGFEAGPDARSCVGQSRVINVRWMDG